MSTYLPNKPGKTSAPPAAVQAALAAVEAQCAPFGRGFGVVVPPAWPEQQINARWAGITTFMKAAFFPKHDLFKVRVSAAAVPEYDRVGASPRETAAKKAYARRKRVSLATAGRRFGSEVHRALDVLVALSQRQGGGVGLRPRSLPRDAELKARQILNRLAAMNLQVLRTEMGIRSLVAGCATAVDIVAWSAGTQTVFLIEVKCGGYGGKFEAGMGAASGPVPTFDDSCLSQAMMQAMLPAEWLVTEGGLPRGSVGIMVLRVKTTPPDNIHVIRYTPGSSPALLDMWKHRARIADHFAAWMGAHGKRNLRPRGAPRPKARSRVRATRPGAARPAAEDADAVIVVSDSE